MIFSILISFLEAFEHIDFITIACKVFYVEFQPC